MYRSANGYNRQAPERERELETSLDRLKATLILRGVHRCKHYSPTRSRRLKRRQQATWASGDYAVIGTTLRSSASCWRGRGHPPRSARARRCRRQRQRHARRRSSVGPRNLDRLCAGVAGARARPGRGRTPAGTFQEADAEQLPFADSAFDVVLSVFGVMFTATRSKPPRAAAGVPPRRHDRPGKLDARGLYRPVFRTIGKYVPPPAGVKSPALWGTEQRLRELFGDGSGS